MSTKPREEVLLQYFRTSQSVREVMLDIVDGSDLTPDEFVVLSVIGELRAVTPTELAERLGMPPTTISRYAARFVSEGLAVRAVNPSDGRSYFLEVTTQGRAVLSKIVPRLRRANQQLAELMDVVAMSSALAHFEEALGTVSNGATADV